MGNRLMKASIRATSEQSTDTDVTRYLPLANEILRGFTESDFLKRAFVAWRLKALRRKWHCSLQGLNAWVWRVGGRQAANVLFDDIAEADFRSRWRRFVPKRLTAPSGRRVWCVWDNDIQAPSDFIFHPTATTRREIERFLSAHADPTDDMIWGKDEKPTFQQISKTKND